MYFCDFVFTYRKPHLQNTIQLLLKRGANPNASNIPMSALFFAVKSADPAAVSALLKQSADTSCRLKPLVGVGLIFKYKRNRFTP